MKTFKVALVLLLAVLSFTACKKEAAVATATNDVANALPPEPTNAQPRLETMQLFLGPESLETEIAATFEQCRSGLMFRTNLAENAGMLFIFPQPVRASFWMKNTFLPLSIAYIDPAGVVQEIHDMQPQKTNSIVANSDNILYGLEVNQGWFQRHHISTGTLVRTEKGSLGETFFGRSANQRR